MGFEYDPQKSRLNLEKHGIDFEEAKRLWKDGYGIELLACLDDEIRYQLIGRIDELHWTAVYTYREDTVRIISVRRARKKEVAIYEG